MGTCNKRDLDVSIIILRFEVYMSFDLLNFVFM